MNRSSSVLLASLTALGLLVAVHPAMAQGVAAPGRGSAAGQSRQRAAPEVQPDALPGAHTDDSRVTPADRSSGELQPTEALFDAINRGDLASVRAAISRGADLGGRNTLGLSPLELSVDLGRNDITFVLLSYKGMEGASSSRRPPPQLVERRRGGRVAARADSDPDLNGRVVARGADAGPSAAIASVPRPARQYANDGGTPVPSAGFLGFGH